MSLQPGPNNKCVIVNVAPVTGACFVKAADGHGFSYWWEVEESGTADCPALCGKWSYFGGFGRFDGLKGKGNWKVTSQFGQTGSMGTWTNSYSMP